jgi:hypothetical protein
MLHPCFLNPLSHPSPFLPGVEGQGKKKGEVRGRAEWAGRSASWRTEGIRREGEEAEGTVFIEMNLAESFTVFVPLKELFWKREARRFRWPGDAIGIRQKRGTRDNPYQELNVVLRYWLDTGLPEKGNAWEINVGQLQGIGKRYGHRHSHPP